MKTWMALNTQFREKESPFCAASLGASRLGSTWSFLGWARMATPPPCSPVRPCWRSGNVGSPWSRWPSRMLVTLTAPLVKQAAVVVFLVTGVAKATILHEVFDGPHDSSRLPSQLIRPMDWELRWSVDRAKASLVIQETPERTRVL